MDQAHSMYLYFRYSCSTGHDLQGDAVLFCDGTAWNGTKPSCQPRQTKPGDAQPRGTYQPRPSATNMNRNNQTKQDGGDSTSSISGPLVVWNEFFKWMLSSCGHELSSVIFNWHVLIVYTLYKVVL